MRRIILSDDVGCMQCGRGFSALAPAAFTVFVKNEALGLRVGVPAHAKCNRFIRLGVGRYDFLARLNHVLQDHKEHHV